MKRSVAHTHAAREENQKTSPVDHRANCASACQRPVTLSALTSQ